MLEGTNIVSKVLQDVEAVLEVTKVQIGGKKSNSEEGSSDFETLGTGLSKGLLQSFLQQCSATGSTRHQKTCPPATPSLSPRHMAAQQILHGQKTPREKQNHQPRHHPADNNQPYWKMKNQSEW